MEHQIINQSFNNLIYNQYRIEQDSKNTAYIIHMLTSPGVSFFTNGYLIEAADGVVAIDTFMTVSDAKAQRALLDSLNKPLIAIIISHGHPDHYNGNSVMLAGFDNVPVISSQGIHDCIRDTVDAKEIKWKPFFGADWPSEKVLPNQIIHDGSRLTLAGLPFCFTELGAAESNSDMYFTVGERPSVVFAGDVVFNQMHGFMNDGHSQQWLQVLHRLNRQLNHLHWLFTGHGLPGEPAQLINQQIQYIQDYQRHVINLGQGAKQLNPEQKTQLTAAMTQAYPDYQLTGFIQAGADAVAAEMASGVFNERTDEKVDEKIIGSR